MHIFQYTLFLQTLNSYIKTARIYGVTCDVLIHIYIMKSLNQIKHIYLTSHFITLTYLKSSLVKIPNKRQMLCK
jgi:hypothetical protein